MPHGAYCNTVSGIPERPCKKSWVLLHQLLDRPACVGTGAVMWMTPSWILQTSHCQCHMDQKDGGKDEKENRYILGSVQFERQHYFVMKLILYKLCGDAEELICFIWGLKNSEWQAVGMGREKESKKRCIIISPFMNVHSWQPWALGLSCREYD